MEVVLSTTLLDKEVQLDISYAMSLDTIEKVSIIYNDIKPSQSNNSPNSPIVKKVIWEKKNGTPAPESYFLSMLELGHKYSILVDVVYKENGTTTTRVQSNSQEVIVIGVPMKPVIDEDSIIETPVSITFKLAGLTSNNLLEKSGYSPVTNMEVVLTGPTTMKVINFVISSEQDELLDEFVIDGTNAAGVLQDDGLHEIAVLLTNVVGDSELSDTVISNLPKIPVIELGNFTALARITYNKLREQEILQGVAVLEWGKPSNNAVLEEINKQVLKYILRREKLISVDPSGVETWEEDKVEEVEPSSVEVLDASDNFITYRFICNTTDDLDLGDTLRYFLTAENVDGPSEEVKALARVRYAELPQGPVYTRVSGDKQITLNVTDFGDSKGFDGESSEIKLKLNDDDEETDEVIFRIPFSDFDGSGNYVLTNSKLEDEEAQFSLENGKVYIIDLALITKDPFQNVEFKSEFSEKVSIPFKEPAAPTNVLIVGINGNREPYTLFNGESAVRVYFNLSTDLGGSKSLVNGEYVDSFKYVLFENSTELSDSATIDPSGAFGYFDVASAVGVARQFSVQTQVFNNELNDDVVSEKSVVSAPGNAVDYLPPVNSLTLDDSLTTTFNQVNMTGKGFTVENIQYRRVLYKVDMSGIAELLDNDVLSHFGLLTSTAQRTIITTTVSGDGHYFAVLITEAQYSFDLTDYGLGTKSGILRKTQEYAQGSRLLVTAPEAVNDLKTFGLNKAIRALWEPVTGYEEGSNQVQFVELDKYRVSASHNGTTIGPVDTTDEKIILALDDNSNGKKWLFSVRMIGKVHPRENNAGQTLVTVNALDVLLPSITIQGNDAVAGAEATKSTDVNLGPVEPELTAEVGNKSITTTVELDQNYIIQSLGIESFEYVFILENEKVLKVNIYDLDSAEVETLTPHQKKKLGINNTNNLSATVTREGDNLIVVFDGLKNGKSYELKVFSQVTNTDDIAVSSTSVSKQGLVPRNPPGLVEDVEFSVDNQEIMLTWNQPSNDGGANAFNGLLYEVEWYTHDPSNNESYWNTKVDSQDELTSTHFTISGLTNGTDYGVYIRAYYLANSIKVAGGFLLVNASDDEEDAAIRPNPAPEKPELELVAMDQSVKLTITFPTDSELYRHTSYKVLRNGVEFATGSLTYDDSGVVVPSEVVLTDKNLVNGTEYTYVVQLVPNYTFAQASVSEPKSATPSGQLFNVQIDGSYNVTLNQNGLAPEAWVLVANSGSNILVAQGTVEDLVVVDGQVVRFTIEEPNGWAELEITSLLVCVANANGVGLGYRPDDTDNIFKSQLSN
jgi:hypothetical protein